MLTDRDLRWRSAVRGAAARHYPENRVEHHIQALAHVLGQKAQHAVAIFLKQEVFTSVPAVGVGIGQMLAGGGPSSSTASRASAHSRSTSMCPVPSNAMGNSAFRRNLPLVAESVSRRQYRNASVALRARWTPSAVGGGGTRFGPHARTDSPRAHPRYRAPAVERSPHSPSSIPDRREAVRQPASRAWRWPIRWQRWTFRRQRWEVGCLRWTSQRLRRVSQRLRWMFRCQRWTFHRLRWMIRCPQRKPRCPLQNSQ